MCRGGRRSGSGVKKGDKRGPYTKKAATKKRSEPSAASTAMLKAFAASRNMDDAPQDELDGGAHMLEVDDKSTVRANVGPSKDWQLASVGTTRQIDHDHNMGGGEGA